MAEVDEVWLELMDVLVLLVEHCVAYTVIVLADGLTPSGQNI